MDFIDPRIGTGGLLAGAGNHNPAAQYPYGALRLGPDTAQMIAGQLLVTNWQHCGGYSYSDNVVRAFSHTHFVGAGVTDYGNFGVMPIRARSEEELERALLHPPHRALPLVHAEEHTAPGLYELNFTAAAVRARLAAAGTHAGVHEYHFLEHADEPANHAASCGVLVDVCHNARGAAKQCRDATVDVRPHGSGAVLINASLLMAGALSGRAPSGGVRMYWAAVVEARTSSPVPWRLWTAEGLRPDGAAFARANGTLGVFVHASCSSSTAAAPHVRVRAALSFISMHAAVANRRTQAPNGTTVEASAEGAMAAWAVPLGAVRVADPADAADSALRAFHTAVYRTHLAPTTWDEDRRYLGFDGAVHTLSAARAHAYTDLSLWDVHRTQLPWLSLLDRAVYRDVVASLRDMSLQAGRMPRWPLANVDGDCMIGDHGVVVVAEATHKQLTPPVDAAWYALMRRRAIETRPCAAEWRMLGYAPIECFAQSPSLTLAYAFDDACLATVATRLGEHADASNLSAGAAHAVNASFDAHRGLMCARTAGGTTVCPHVATLPPLIFKAMYTEGNGAQWTWFVPQDPAGLAELFGPSRFIAKLDQLMAGAHDWPFGPALPNTHYWAGNEPDLLAPWLYAFAGAQHRTAVETRWLCEHAYSDTPAGLPGNDDFGTMSAWLVWARLGIYPLAGSDLFVIGSPTFAEVLLQRGNSVDLTLRAHNASRANIHVGRAQINGRPLSQPFVRFGDLAPPSDDNAEGVAPSLLEMWMVPTASQSAWYGPPRVVRPRPHKG